MRELTGGAALVAPARLAGGVIEERPSREEPAGEAASSGAANARAEPHTTVTTNTTVDARRLRRTRTLRPVPPIGNWAKNARLGNRRRRETDAKNSEKTGTNPH
jgi:hypothetical protein